MSSSRHSVDHATLEQMEEERDHLLESIEDLDRERESGDLGRVDYEDLRSGYTTRAAAVLRAIERARLGGASDAPSSDGARGPGGRRRSRRWRWSVASLAGAVAAGAIVGSFALAGALGSGTSPSNGVPSSRAVAADLSAARVLSARGDDADALSLYNQILRVVPQQAEALAYRGWILRQAGVATHDDRLLSAGRSSVEASVAADPTYPDARAFLGYIRFEDQRDPKGAVTQFRTFLSDHPPARMIALTRSVVAAAFAAVGEPVPPASSPGPY